MIKELWQILTTVANLSNEAKRYDREIQQLRKDVNNLTLTVTELKHDLANAQVATKLVLDNYKSEINHAKESITAKFDVLTTRLDLKVADFERRMASQRPRRKTSKALNKAPKH